MHCSKDEAAKQLQLTEERLEEVLLLLGQDQPPADEAVGSREGEREGTEGQATGGEGQATGGEGQATAHRRVLGEGGAGEGVSTELKGMRRGRGAGGLRGAGERGQESGREGSAGQQQRRSGGGGQLGSRAKAAALEAAEEKLRALVQQAEGQQVEGDQLRR